MAYTSSYTEKITKLLDDLGGSSYTSPYQPALNDAAQAVKDYGEFDSRYDPQIQSTADRIANYGDYSGQYTGQLGKVTDQINNYGNYAGRYQQQINDLIGNITNRGQFTYDPEQDASYQAYKDQYTRLGEKAMQNTLGQVSARTGGLASSWAGTQAQQSYNDYMQQLSNIIPQLEQIAYGRWRDEGQDMRQNLSMYQDLDATEYGRWNDALNQLYNRQNMLQGMDATEYGRWNDTLNQLYNLNNMYQNLDNTDYSRWLDTLNNLYNQEGMYLGLDQNAFSQWQGQQGNMYEYLSALQKQDDIDYGRYMDELKLAMAASGGSGGSGGRSGGSGSTSSAQPASSIEFNQYAMAMKQNGATNQDIVDMARAAYEDGMIDQTTKEIFEYKYGRDTSSNSTYSRKTGGNGRTSSHATTR